MMNSDAFTYLRTQKQLGYIVWAGKVDVGDVLHFFVLVQGSKELPNAVDKDIESFLKLQRGKLANASYPFAATKNSLISTIQQ
jgi:secreted Zn-dependent insulinase-like peptidase